MRLHLFFLYILLSPLVKEEILKLFYKDQSLLSGTKETLLSTDLNCI